MEEKLIKRGAEAELWKTNWLGLDALKKVRVPKKYRAVGLDNEIRVQRTRQEARALHAVKQWGIRVPFVLEVQPKQALLVMEWVEGPTLKEALQNRKVQRAQKLKWCTELGKMAGILHSHGLVHGDLTTSNVLVEEKAKGKNSKAQRPLARKSKALKENASTGLALIDFGLTYYSNKLEDLAVDVIGLKKTYAATHFDFPQGWKTVLQGYARAFKGARKVFARMEKVEGRVRYA